MADTGKILIQVVDGTRQPFTGNIGIRLLDGEKNGGQEMLVRQGPMVTINDVPCFGNRRDDYTVLVSADGMAQSGVFPIAMNPNTLHPVFLMLVPKNARLNFHDATWDRLKETHKDIVDLFKADADDEATAKARYEGLLDRNTNATAGLWNIITALGQIHLSKGTALSYFRQLDWNTVGQDRFFGYADKELLEQVKLGVNMRQFAPELKPGVFHDGATESYKQLAFGEANVQITFHGNDPAPNANWIRVEPDIDLFRDSISHAFLEVVPNLFTKQKTDPSSVYVMRWMAGRQASIPEFDPPYTLRA